MGASASISYVGDKLVCGFLDTSFLTASSRLVPGTLVANGPCYFGMPAAVGVARATVMIGPPVSTSVPASLEVLGIANIYGSLNVFAISTFSGLTTKLGTTIKQALSLKNGVDIANALKVGNTTKVQNGTDNVNGVLNVAGVINCAWLEGRLAAAMASPPKGFDMHHPTKKGWRLTHICIEGPEAAVYYRGTLEGKNVIELPDYWRGLVDFTTITVQLTPKGCYQELFYEVIGWGTAIQVTNAAGGPVNCSYVVFGERKDVDKIVVEYEGKIEDYPGRDQRSIVGYHYDYREGVNG
jgi:hypothetical protein